MTETERKTETLRGTERQRDTEWETDREKESGNWDRVHATISYALLFSTIKTSERHVIKQVFAFYGNNRIGCSCVQLYEVTPTFEKQNIKLPVSKLHVRKLESIQLSFESGFQEWWTEAGVRSTTVFNNNGSAVWFLCSWSQFVGGKWPRILRRVTRLLNKPRLLTVLFFWRKRCYVSFIGMASMIWCSMFVDWNNFKSIALPFETSKY